MSIARQIRVQKLQNKNRMVGQTFNPSGHTSESLNTREQELINQYKNMLPTQREELYNQFKEMNNWKEKNNIHCSNSFEQNVFMRNFAWQFK